MNTTIGQNESVLIRDADNMVTPFNITIVSIGDCRCPSNPEVNCVHAGWGSADFRTEGFNFSLRIGESKEFLTGRSSFRLTLIDVLPYPTLENHEEEKKAIFVVEMI